MNGGFGLVLDGTVMCVCRGEVMNGGFSLVLDGTVMCLCV